MIILWYEVVKGLRAAYVTITQSFFSTKPLPAMAKYLLKWVPLMLLYVLFYFWDYTVAFMEVPVIVNEMLELESSDFKKEGRHAHSFQHILGEEFLFP